MIQVEANESLRNVAKDSLKGTKLLNDSVFFGINGSGKTTVCEALSRATFNAQEAGLSEPIRIYAFNHQWRKDKVGDFVEGSSAPGVTTVTLGDGASDLEEMVRSAEAAWKSAKNDVKAKQQQEDDTKKRLENIVDRVANGVRKNLKNDCSSLDERHFQRPRIRALLDTEENKVLSPNEVQDNINIANSDDPGYLIPLPTLPNGWAFSDELWQQTTEKMSTTQTLTMVINDWVREGLNQHKAGDSCQFCGGVVSEQRLRSLEDAIRFAEEEAPVLVKNQLVECQDSISALENFQRDLEAIRFNTSLYSATLPMMQSEVVLETRRVLDELNRSKNLLDARVKNPHDSIEGKKPEIDFSKLQDEYKRLQATYDEARDKITKHATNRESAILLLRKHCCAIDGSDWGVAKKAHKDAIDAKQAADKVEKDTKQRLDDLKKQVSTTAATAKFLDENLCMILGDQNLRVSEGSTGEGYRITRRGEKALSMSEGEKKLVSLLYFCAEFLAEDRKQSLKNSVVLFDDLGSELDEARLLSVDRFISNHFQNPKPASLVYFTHSHTYLKILQSRLAGKAVNNKNDGKPPTAIFYEVYKDIFNRVEQSTRCRQWDNEAVRLTNDYWLSFYMLLRAFEKMQEGKPPELGTGNFCRKVLEGFTEFRAPNSDKFGSRIDTITAQNKIQISPALSKIVNDLSHTDLNRQGGALSRNEVELAVIQTLNFLKTVDSKHFHALLIKFRGKEGAEKLESDISFRIGHAVRGDL
ncbi:Uncharacterized protein conserved in bacteria [Chlamydia trachomatis]|nr:Uncharacterized protein conserved in bacteria [Chlamydia trachomatis]